MQERKNKAIQWKKTMEERAMVAMIPLKEYTTEEHRKQPGRTTH